MKNINIETIKAYWMATMAMGETREEMEAVWKAGTEDLMEWFEGELELGITEEEMIETIKEHEAKKKAEEEKKMANAQVNVIEIEVEGIRYTQTRPGYYYKKVDGKQTRIPKAEWEQAFDAYTAQVDEADEQWDAGDEVQSRKDLQDQKDRETEQNFNKPTRKEVTVEGMWDGDTDVFTVKVGDEVMLRTYNHEEAIAEAKKLGWVSPDEKAAKKASKPRKSKDIAHESNGITLTAKQVDFIKHIPDTCFYENGLDSTPWCDCLADEIGGQFANKPMTVGAMISTLREKGLIYVSQDRINGKKVKFFGFTDMGKQVATELGLN